MKWPPYLLKMKFAHPRHRFAIWLPLFIVGPLVFVLLLAVFLIILPFALLAMLFTWETRWWQPALLWLPSLMRVVCYLPGLEVNVENREGQVFIKFR